MNKLQKEQQRDEKFLAASVRLRALIDANWTTQAIAAAVQLRLPELLISGPQTLEGLAQQTS